MIRDFREPDLFCFVPPKYVKIVVAFSNISDLYPSHFTTFVLYPICQLSTMA